MVRMGGMTLRVNRPPFATNMQPNHHMDENVGLPLTNPQRQVLVSLFQRYVLRVSGPESQNAMCRSTWFRLLYHCGLLGPSCVHFSEGTAVFTMFSEVGTSGATMGIQVLTFSAWMSAMHHILKNPRFGYESQHELVDQFFNVVLKRCDEWWLQGSELKRFGCKEWCLQGSEKARASSPGCPRKRREAVALNGWQSDLAEEQMCEPEVLQLLHEFEPALRQIFQHYGLRDAEGASADAGSAEADAAEAGAATSEDVDVSADDVHDNQEELGRAFGYATDGGQGQVERNEAVSFQPCIPPEAFETMLREFRFFPMIVQTHSARQHIRISLKRHRMRELSFAAFVECICRISFVYLSLYGNSVQQGAPSKRKCLWLFTLLRAGCRELGINTPGREGVDVFGEERDMWQSRKKCNLDGMLLERLVLWEALDAKLDVNRSPNG